MCITNFINNFSYIILFIIKKQWKVQLIYKMLYNLERFFTYYTHFILYILYILL